MPQALAQESATTLRAVPNALVTIDQNRATVIERIVGEWGDRLASSNAGISTAQLRQILSGLRADHLLAASLVGSIEGLRDVVSGALLRTDTKISPTLMHTKSLGDTADDLVYTSIVPCRIVDTRSGGGGVFAPQTQRNWLTYSPGGFAVQGGSATACGIPVRPAAVMVNTTLANTVGGPEFFTLWPFGQTRPNASTLVVTAPHGLDRARVLQLVAGKADWVVDRLADFDAIRHFVSKESPLRPQAFDLPALAESWRVEYKETRSRTVGARVDQPERIVVSGAIDDVEDCRAALRRWLARRAKDTLPSWLSNVGQQSRLRYVDLSIKNQRTRWGSCTVHGRISLNCRLLFLPRELVRYVMVYELCHLLEANHSDRFWAHLRQLEPIADTLHGRMRDAWKLVPVWAHRGSNMQF